MYVYIIIINEGLQTLQIIIKTLSEHANNEHDDIKIAFNQLLNINSQILSVKYQEMRTNDDIKK